MHHCPQNSGDKGFTPLTAVHVANALEYEGIADNDDLPVAVLDATYLRQLKLEDRVSLWRDAKSDPGAAKFENLMSRAKSGAKSAAKPATATPAGATAKAAPKPGGKSAPAPLQPQRAPIPPLWKWVGIGVGVAATLAVLARLEIMRLQDAQDKPDTEAAAENPAPPVKQDAAAVAPVKAPDATKPAPTNEV